MILQPDDYGDKDKLAHFFGNAFIGYAQTYWISEIYLVILWKRLKKILRFSQHVDLRDMMTNTLGQLFGNILKENKNILPSQIFINSHH